MLLLKLNDYIALGTSTLNILAVLSILMLMCLWLIFEKAHRPGWGVLIPLYNIYILQTVAGKKWWWFLVFLTGFIPVIGFVTVTLWYIVVNLALAKQFNKNRWFGLGLILCFFLFYPILAFGKAKYKAESN